MHAVTPARLGLLLRRRALLYAQRALTLWGPVAIVIALTAFVAEGDDAGSDASFFTVWYGAALLAVGYLATGRALPEFSEADGRQSYLTLPASDAEKWLATYLTTGPILVVSLTTGFWLLSTLLSVLTGYLGVATYEPFDPLGEATGKVVLVYLILVHPIALLGAAAFNRHAWGKTLAVGFASLLALASVAALAFRIAYRDYFDGWISRAAHLEGPVEGTLTAGFEDAAGVAFGLALLAASYFKFQEKHV